MRLVDSLQVTSGVVVLALFVSGCLAPGLEGGEEAEGVRLEDRRVCGGPFSDGTPVSCEQEAAESEVLEAPPPGWVPFRSQHVEGEAQWYFSAGLDEPGLFRLGLDYEIERGAIDQEISLDPIHGVLFHDAWDALAMWEHSMSGFVVFPEPVPQEGEFTLLIFHPHTVAMNTSLFNVSIETPQLHDKPLEPLWRFAGDDIRVVHRVHGEGGPYYFHEGQPDTQELGLSLGQRGVDYSILSRFINLAGESGELRVPLTAETAQGGAKRVTRPVQLSIR